MSAHGIGSTQHIDQLDTLNQERKTPSTAHANYLEQAGDVTVVNTFLKVLSLVLVLAVFVGAGATYAVVQHYRDFRPIVIRVDSVGKAEAVTYGEATYHPEEKELRYFLSQWAQFYYGRNRFTVRQDFPKAFFFMDTKLASNVIASHQQAKDIEQFLANSAAPNTYIEVTQITLDHLSQPPYVGTIEFTAKQVAPYSDDVVSSSHYTTNVQFTIRPDVPNNVITVNPLGFTIVAFHDQQAFN
jgi:type IV secretion system protein VirB5